MYAEHSHPPMVLVHVDCAPQPPLLLVHSLKSSVQSPPVHAGLQSHWKPFGRSVHGCATGFAFSPHGIDAHSSISVAHSTPSKPGPHWHAKLPMPSTHVPLLRHGAEAHS